ncbi:hypothetical protein AruPA_17860 [Acidiphilium sp. PA]|uniref:hypothetical protein n=1 Tax=Acidiphilium sp. PA TaxID=2871705 RepID=UPI002243C518|nr:hypothetical protein [Acidiphilium sp. PA]MCW8308902.1 hypothetical protein [Acidiphilium sp. PA]
MSLFIEPGAGSAPIVRFIETARHPADIEVYYLSIRYGEGISCGLETCQCGTLI